MKTKRRFWCSAGTWYVTSFALSAAAITAPACSEAFTCSDTRSCEPGGGGGTAGKGTSSHGGAGENGGLGAQAGADTWTGGAAPQAGNGGQSSNGGAPAGTTGGVGGSDSVGGDDSNGGSATGGTTGAGGSGGSADIATCPPPTSGPAQCTAECPCGVGAGQCMNNSGCNAGLTCGLNTGAKFGFGGNTCVPKHCDNDVVDADETSIDCGGECGCTAEFMRLGGAPSTATDVNRDGTVVVGKSGKRAFRWTLANGMDVLLNDLAAPGGTFSASEASAVSSSGSLVVGTLFDGSIPPAASPFQWLSRSMTLVSASNGSAFGVSGDGSTICGQVGNHEGIVWRGSSSTAFGHTVSDTGSGAQVALSASEDGAVVVGYAFNPSGLERAVVAERNVGEKALSPVGGIAATHANSVSSDGLVIVGWGASATDDSQQAYTWTRTAPGTYTAERLGDLDGGTVTSDAIDVSGNGSIVVGYGTTAKGKEPFIWDKQRGMRRLVDELGARGYEWPGATSLGTVAAISTDGTTIVGSYINPSNETEGWRIVLR